MKLNWFMHLVLSYARKITEAQHSSRTLEKEYKNRKGSHWVAWGGGRFCRQFERGAKVRQI